MADLPYITHVPSQGTLTKTTEKEERVSRIASRPVKIKASARHLHQKPAARPIPVRKVTPKPVEKIEEPEPVVEKTPVAKKSHSFVLEDLEPPKTPKANPLKRAFGQFLQKKEKAVAPAKKVTKKQETQLGPMAKRLYFGIANALSDQQARDKAHALFSQSLEGNETDAVLIGNKLYRISDVSGPNTVDDQFIVKAKVTLEGENPDDDKVINLKTFIDLLSTPAPEPEEEAPMDEVVPPKSFKEEIPEPVKEEPEEIDEVLAPPEPPMEEPKIEPEPEPEPEPKPEMKMVAEEQVEEKTDEKAGTDEPFTHKELLTIVKHILHNAIKHVDYGTLVAPFHEGNISSEALEALLTDERTRNATVVVYGPTQLEQVLSTLGMKDHEVKELVQDAEGRKEEWGIAEPEYSLRFYNTIEGPRLYSLNIIEKPR